MAPDQNQHSALHLTVAKALVEVYDPGDPEYREAMTALDGLVEQLEAANRALADAVWDGQRQGFQAVREAISGRIAAPLVDEILEDARIILSASSPASRRDDGHGAAWVSGLMHGRKPSDEELDYFRELHGGDEQ